MKHYTYKDCTISQTLSCLAATGAPLYQIAGRFDKAASVRPFFTTAQHARDYINCLILSEEMRDIEIKA